MGGRRDGNLFVHFKLDTFLTAFHCMVVEVIKSLDETKVQTALFPQATWKRDDIVF